MILSVVCASIGLILGGPVLAIALGLAAPTVRRIVQKPMSDPPTRLVLMLLLVELRSGSSVLAALQATAGSLPGYRDLQRASRLATVAGLTETIEDASPTLRPVLAQLARSQRSGASLVRTVHGMLEQDLANERARRISAVRSLPVRLMVPIALLMLPGLMLLVYAPSLYALFDDLTGVWS